MARPDELISHGLQPRSKGIPLAIPCFHIAFRDTGRCSQTFRNIGPATDRGTHRPQCLKRKLRVCENAFHSPCGQCISRATRCNYQHTQSLTH